MLATGFSPEKILADLAASDRYADYRQIGVLDRSGLGAASTGGKPQPWSGHLVGENYVAMANSATREAVVHAMAAAFEQHREQELDERQPAAATGSTSTPRAHRSTAERTIPGP